MWFDAFPGLDPSRDTSWVLLIGSSAAAVVLLVATRGQLGLQSRHDSTAPELESAVRPAREPVRVS